ncbi:response regulator receiver domain-containing protein [Flavobacterium endophyticum]|uniref:Response regulator receiver domain-containing protein n=1 Tax=Flavobacterium endophyticum TaxID=1540163 RepID=A0A495MHJ3_9FLAO|nr:response regulator [Flavobacterium endophyticum]RKS25424.1 response regulator receiver domain-containing protein [Flavobacterium endophyticum]
MLHKILCVDDDPITLMLYKMVIAKASFTEEIITAKNGQEALDYYNNLRAEGESQSPELIFLDLNMPVMGGWEFLDNFTKSEYQEFNAKTKVIVLSSTIDPTDIEKSKTYSIVIDFLSKPITKEMLEDLKDRL